MNIFDRIFGKGNEALDLIREAKGNQALSYEERAQMLRDGTALLADDPSLSNDLGSGLQTAAKSGLSGLGAGAVLGSLLQRSAGRYDRAFNALAHDQMASMPARVQAAALASAGSPRNALIHAIQKDLPVGSNHAALALRNKATGLLGKAGGLRTAGKFSPAVAAGVLAVLGLARGVGQSQRSQQEAMMAASDLSEAEDFLRKLDRASAIGRMRAGEMRHIDVNPLSAVGKVYGPGIADAVSSADVQGIMGSD